MRILQLHAYTGSHVYNLTAGQLAQVVPNCTHTEPWLTSSAAAAAAVDLDVPMSVIVVVAKNSSRDVCLLT